MNKKYEELDFTDDFFFCKILIKNQTLCKELLELILQVKIAKIIFTAKQNPIEIKADAKGIRLDVYVEDAENTVYDIEMQPTAKKNLPKRSRYYQGMIDLNLIERGADYKELKKSFVIFICLSDPFDKGLHLYTFENQCHECPELLLGDETTKVFINAAGTADDVSQDMKDFLDYLQGKGTKNEFTQRIDDEVSKARAHEEWRLEYMSLFLRDQEMREEGREEERRALVMNMLEENESVEKICLYLKCDKSFVEEIKNSVQIDKFSLF
ncbi:MAG: Rpn family recombination-promoting nuclease/putative transposase [Agathobacter sp.]|nr:Rpn family recombination-promoting nuclease/putative transposase [Agathobacter sp.]